MNRLAGLTLIAALLVVGTSSIAFASALREADDDAIYAVEAYLSALITGDTAALKHFLSPEMIKARETLLDNPDYSRNLQDEYSGAFREITSSEQLNADEAQVDATITLGNGETLTVRFLVSRSDDGYLIVSEN